VPSRSALASARAAAASLLFCATLNPSTAAEKRAAWSAKVEALVAEVEAAGDEEAATKLNSGPSAALAILGASDSYSSDGSCWAIGRKELRRSQVVCLPRFTKIQRGTFLRTVDWCGPSAAEAAAGLIQSNVTGQSQLGQREKCSQPVWFCAAAMPCAARGPLHQRGFDQG
jgi:hypothetical protein